MHIYAYIFLPLGTNEASHAFTVAESSLRVLHSFLPLTPPGLACRAADKSTQLLLMIIAATYIYHYNLDHKSYRQRSYLSCDASRRQREPRRRTSPTIGRIMRSHHRFD